MSIYQYWGVGLVGDWTSEWVIGGQLGSIGGAGWPWGDGDNVFILKGVL